jgi:hypothetical protein
MSALAGSITPLFVMQAQAAPYDVRIIQKYEGYRVYSTG